MEEKRTSLAPLIIAIGLLLPLVYLGAYAALVRPDAAIVQNSGGQFELRYYRAGGAISETLFWPLESLHRKLRPADWYSPYEDTRLLPTALPQAT